MSSSRQFWKPGTIAPGIDIERSKEDGEMFVYNEFQNLSLRQQRLSLPIYLERKRILYAVENYRCVIIIGETGSGKTTQIPQYLDEIGWTKGSRCIACTQPRRVAAVTISARVAEEMNVKLGQDVGYSIRFNDCTDPDRTRIKYMTDGMLVRETMSDPLLMKYSVIMIDEAHERSLYTDILLGLMKKILKRRKDLRIIVSSATLNAQKFHDFFNLNVSSNKKYDTSIIVPIKGRQFPVDTFYIKEPLRNYVNGVVTTVCHIHSNLPDGDILAFLTGRQEIENGVKMINDLGDQSIHAYPLYAGLSMEQQLRSVRPSSHNLRKVILATNIAETSITIPSIVYVIDCGFVKVSAYNSKSGIEKLVVIPISKASANQRAGRAGRLRNGKCFRLYRQIDFDNLSIESIPDIQRCDLTQVVLQLKALGIDNIANFDFLSPPPIDLLEKSLELLYSLGALDDNGQLTEKIGTIMAEFPIDPRITKMLLTAGEMNCTDDVLSIAAMLSVDNIFLKPRASTYNRAERAHRKYRDDNGDHLTYLNVYNEFLLNGKSAEWCREEFLNYRALKRASQIRKQLRRLLVRYKIPLVLCEEDEMDNIRRAIVSGFFANAAQMKNDGTYQTVRGKDILNVHSNSVLYQSATRWVIFHELVETNQICMRDLLRIKPSWLSELAPHFYVYKGIASIQQESSLNNNNDIEQNYIDESGRRVKHRRLF